MENLTFYNELFRGVRDLNDFLHFIFYTFRFIHSKNIA